MILDERIDGENKGLKTNVLGRWICKILFTLLVLILIVDPTNTFFKAKEIIFLLFLVSCFLFRIKIEFRFLLIVGFFFLSTCISLISGYLQDFSFNREFILVFLKSLLFLVILLFVTKFNFLKSIFNASLVVAIITIIVAFIFINGYAFSTKMYEYFCLHDDFIMVNMNRTFLGVQFISFYYKTSSVLVIPFSFSLYRAFNRKKWGTYGLIALLFFIALMLSGSRANLFSTILILFLIIINQLYKSKFWHSISMVLLIFFLSLSVLTSIILLTDQEDSVLTKSDHIASMLTLFKEHPFILLSGQGPGSFYYSSAANSYISVSEVSYMEIIRMFGVVLGGIIIFIFIFPLIIVHKRKARLNEHFPFTISYLAYLFIGGTNPLLLGSTGFLVLALGYSIALNDEEYEC